MSLNHLLRSPPELEIFAKKLTADEIDAQKIVTPELTTDAVVANDVYVRTNYSGPSGPAYRLDQSSEPWAFDDQSVLYEISPSVLPTPLEGAYKIVTPTLGIFARSGNRSTISGNFLTTKVASENTTGYQDIRFLVPQLQSIDPTSISIKFKSVSQFSNGYPLECYLPPFVTGLNAPGGSPTYINIPVKWPKAAGYVSGGIGELFYCSVEISWLESYVFAPVVPPPLEEQHIKPVVFVEGGVYKAVEEDDEKPEEAVSEETEETEEDVEGTDEPEVDVEVEPEVEHLVPDHVEAVVPEHAVTHVVKPKPVKKPRKGRRFRDSHAKYFPEQK